MSNLKNNLVIYNDKIAAVEVVASAKQSHQKHQIIYTSSNMTKQKN